MRYLWPVLLLCLLWAPTIHGGMAYNPDRADTHDRGYQAAVVSVGTTQVEAKVGGTRDAKRQRLLMYNDSSVVVYYGPTGVTTSGSTKGVPIYKRQVVVIPVGDVGVYLIAGTASNDVIVQELK